MIGVLETLSRRYRKPPLAISRIVSALALSGFGELVRAWLTQPDADHG